MMFRRDINGLRAIAVTLVILFHFGVSGFDGGFVGVDVFFVISGFLMTSIVFGKLERKQFSLSNFYLDRARRIIPALAVLCVSLMVLGWFFLPASHYALLGKHAASAVFFISNHVFSGEGGYFAAAAHEKWLLHTWSLSVEWQFYLIYPIVVLVLHKMLPLPRVRWVILAASVASFALSVYASSRWPGVSFFLLPTRAWEMLAGGLVYLFPWRWKRISSANVELVGLVMIIGSMLLLTKADVWPGWLAAIPVFGTALVIAAARMDSVVTTNPVSQFLGKISYSVYLWHWPIVVALHYFDKIRELPWMLGGIASSLLLGYVSFATIESRLKFDKMTRRPQAHYWGQVFAIVSLVIVPGIVLLQLSGIPGSTRAINSDEKVMFLAKYENLIANGLHADYRHECDFYDWQTKASRPRIDVSCTNIGMNPLVFIWGDSHAQALSKGVRHLYPGAVAQVATSACRPSLLPQGRSAVDNNCDHSNEYALAEIARVKPKVLVLAQAEGHERTDWDAIAQRLRNIGVKKVLLVGPMPNWRPSLPVVVVRRHWNDHPQYLNDGLDPAPIATDKQLRATYGKSTRLTYVSLIEPLCGASGCLVAPPNEETLLVADYGHLSAPGAVFVAQTILAKPLRAVLPLGEGRKQNQDRRDSSAGLLP